MQKEKRFTKVDTYTIHSLPVQASRKRKENFTIQRKTNNVTVEIQANQTLNTFDLVTLLLLYYEYLVNGYKVGEIHDADGYKIEVAKLEMDLKKFAYLRYQSRVQQKHIDANLQSILRIATASITIKKHGRRERIITKYIYDVRIMDNYNIVIYFNLGLIRLVEKKGIVIDLDTLLNIQNKDYAILLYLHLVGNKVKKEKRHSVNGKVIKKWYVWRQKFTVDELEYATKLDMTKMNKREKLRILKNTINFLNAIGVIPCYVYNKQTRQFELSATGNQKLLSKSKAKKSDTDNTQIDTDNTQIDTDNTQIDTDNTQTKI